MTHWFAKSNPDSFMKIGRVLGKSGYRVTHLAVTSEWVVRPQVDHPPGG